MMAYLDRDGIPVFSEVSGGQAGNPRASGPYIPTKSTSMSIVSGRRRQGFRAIEKGGRSGMMTTAAGADRPATDVGTVRREARSWIDRHFDPAMPLHSWLEVLTDSGWAAPTWPAAWYGKVLTADLASAAAEEFASVGAPGPPAGLGVMLAAPTVIVHGTDELKRRLVRAVLTGDHAWCQLFSEPGAGSDLASLTTHAERDGDDFVIDGQKVWTSAAQIADYGMLLARTDSGAPKHRGITYFALRMDQPGVEIRPLRQMTGDSLFTEVFLSGARVPASDVIGEINGGWAVALTTLAHERTGLGARAGTRFAVAAPGGSRFRAQREAPVGAYVAEAQRIAPGWVSSGASGAAMIGAGAAPLIQLAIGLRRDHDPLVRQQLAQLHTLCQLNSWNGVRSRAGSQAGSHPGAEASIGKLMASQIARLWRDTASEITGPLGMLEGPAGPLAGAVAAQSLAAPGPAIYGGSDQIQRSVIGERVLGLPKEPDMSKDVPFRDLRIGTLPRSGGQLSS
jgi:alkylation response protein AidB-like acyl-CoA dehydrogenase